MRTAFVFCTGVDERIDNIYRLLAGTNIIRDRYPARSPTDHFVSFRVDLDRLVNGMEFSQDATNQEVVARIRHWAYSEEVSPGYSPHSGELRIDHITRFSNYEEDFEFEVDLSDEDALTPEQRELINSHATHRRETFHDNEPEHIDGGDDDDDGEHEDEPVEQFHDDEDGDGDDEEDVVYDDEDPLE